MFPFRKRTKYKSYYAIITRFPSEGNQVESILHLKAHESKKCIPIFKDMDAAKLLIFDFPENYYCKRLSELGISVREINNSNRGYYFIDFGTDGLISYKEGKLNTAEAWKKYLK